MVLNSLVNTEKLGFREQRVYEKNLIVQLNETHFTKEVFPQSFQQIVPVHEELCHVKVFQLIGRGIIQGVDRYRYSVKPNII